MIRKKVNQGRRRGALEGSVVGPPFSLWVPFFYGDWGAGLAQARGPLTLELISTWHLLGTTVADTQRVGPSLGDPRAPHGWDCARKVLPESLELHPRSRGRG